MEKFNDEIFKKEEELAGNKDDYLGAKRLNQEILEPLRNVTAKDMPGSSEIMLCPANDMIQDFPKRFEEYKRTVHKLEELLADRGDPKDDVKRRMDIGALGIEQGEFTRHLVCIKRIQRAQELGK